VAAIVDLHELDIRRRGRELQRRDAALQGVQARVNVRVSGFQRVHGSRALADGAPGADAHVDGPAAL
jgi:hypothetical protein